MTYDDTLRDNLAKADGLAPRVRWAYSAWVTECFAAGLHFRVTETGRTQQRQDELYEVGRRGIPGERPVTWTTHSNHVLGLAADCYPIDCAHAQLIAAAAKYGITHPLPQLDPPHYEMLNVGDEPPAPLPPGVRLAQAENALRFAKGERLSMLDRLITRLRRLIGGVS